MRALRNMLEEFNPFWEDEFATIQDAAEYYGLEAMLEYYTCMYGLDDEEVYTELDFND